MEENEGGYVGEKLRERRDQADRAYYGDEEYERRRQEEEERMRQEAEAKRANKRNLFDSALRGAYRLIGGK